MKPKYYRDSSGQVLMISLWVLFILVIFSISISYRMIIEVRLSRFYRDKLKAYYLARGYLLKLIEEKQTLPISISHLYFPYDDPIPKRELLSQGQIVEYSIIDEQSKFNINEIVNNPDMMRCLAHLLSNISGRDFNEAQRLVENLKDWIDVQDVQEDNVYKSKGYAYLPRNGEIADLSEILLVDGWTEEIFYGDGTDTNKGIVDFITIYGDGKININSCSQEVLNALQKGLNQTYSDFRPRTVANLMDFMAGDNGRVGEGEDDNCLAQDGIVFPPLNISQVFNLNDDWSSVADDIDRYFRNTDWIVLQDLKRDGFITTGSQVLRFEVTAELNKVRQKITAIVKIQDGQILYWYEK